MIKLFKATDKTYSTNGDVVLETAKARVHKEDNGDFYIDVEAPLKDNKKEASYDEGQTIEGTNFSINVDLFKQNELTTLKGNTTQASTPTPDNPVPVNVVSGGQEINVIGKNLFNISNSTPTKASFTFENDILIVQATGGNYNYIQLNPNEVEKTIKENAGKTLKFRLDSLDLSQFDSTNDVIVQLAYSINGTNSYNRILERNASSPTGYKITNFVIPNDTSGMSNFRLNILANNSATATSTSKVVITKPMFYFGEDSTYEAYKGQSYEINLGKNLFDISTADYTNKCTLSNEVYTTDTLTTSARSVNFGYRANNNYTIYPNETYYVSADIRLVSGTATSVNVLALNVSGTKSMIVNPTMSSEFQRYLGSYTNNTNEPIQIGRTLFQPSGTNLDNAVFEIKNVMISKSSNITYAPYKTPIELCKINDYQDFIRKGTGKNLFDKDSGTDNTYIQQDGTEAGYNSSWKISDYISVEPNQKYTYSGLIDVGFSPSSAYYDINKTLISVFKQNTGTNTITIPSNAYYVRFSVKKTDLDSFQIEKGSQATSYEPYGFKDKWYLYKTIGKVVLNGSENWITWNDASAGNTRLFGTSDYNSLSNINYGKLYSNYFESYNDTIWVLDEEKITYSTQATQRLRLRTNKTIANTSGALKTWLSTHNTIVYYILSTPTTTEITDSELISQLEGIELLQGLNNVSVSSGDLSGIITIHYNYVNGYNTSLKYIDYLVPNNIIVANTPQGEQAFRISNVENTRTKIKIKAYHVFYDTENLLIEDSYVVDKNCNDALDHLNNATSDTSPFTTISNINTIANYRCVRKSLYEAIQVVLDRWGGHLVRNNWTIGIYDTIGQDNGVTIRYAKNLKNITATYIWDDVVTKLLPVGKDGLLLNAIDPDASIYVESAMQYDIPYTKTISFSQNSIVEDDYKDESGTLDEDAYKQALVDDLYAQAIEYINNNYLPKVNYNLSANVEKVSDIGDTIEVIDEKLGINVMTNIISYDYDCILDKYIELQFGNFTPQLNSLLQTINDNTEKIVQEENNTLAITLGRELDEATSKIWGALGNSYVIYDGDKILVVDSLPKETATNVIMINNGGIGFSNTGITGTFNSAWTIDNVLNMEQINVINLTADLIKGGTLKLGSNLNQNGKIEVFDEANNLIAELNKNGLKMYGVDGSYVLMNNQVGFAGYDRNNNKIYWVDKDEFHMKKSVVEEEITLVGKMRIIPITIRNGNTIVNDGIGFINVAN